MVAFMDPAALVQMGAWGPNSMGLPVGVQWVSLQLKEGMGPRVEPSHSWQPMALRGRGSESLWREEKG